MIGNLPSQSDKDEDSRFLLLALGEGISDYLQGAAHARNSGDVGDLTKDLLDFDTPVQNFAAGGEVSLKSGLGVTEENPINFPFDDPSGNPNVTQPNNVSTIKPISSILSNTDGPGAPESAIDAGVNTVAGTVAGLASLAIDVATGTPGPLTAFGRITGLTTPVDTIELDTLANQNFFSSEAAAEAAAQEAAEAQAVTDAAGQGVAPGGAATTSGQDAVGATGTGATGIASESGFGSTDGPGGNAGASAGAADAASGGAGASGGGGDATGGEAGILASGGVIKGYQEGDLVEDDQADTQLDALGLGPVGLVDDPDGTTGVADDLAMDLPVNSYVVNKDAATLAGLGSINKLIKDAIDLALEDEVDLPKEIKTAEKIPIRISRGEIVIPAPLVDYIGLKKLENMNNRGLKVRKQREAEEAPVQMAAATSPQQDLLAQIQPVA